MDISQVIQPTQKAGYNEASTNAAAERPVQSTTAGTRDNVELSDEAVFLNQLDNGSIEWGRSFTTNPPVPHTLNEIREWVSSYNEGLRSRVEEIFQQRNVQLEQDLEIQLGAEGQAQVDPSHPQAELAQQALAEHPELNSQLGEQQQRQQLANVLEIGGALHTAQSATERQAEEQNLTRQLNHPQVLQLTVPAEASKPTNEPSQQA
ncbi:MAG: hypothetical protein OEX03_00765 [Gammaproteobacteria bacterium]|nr:hypothetical protein [Gammaproteobacteria bacterium]